jgi:FkbM family methyltransferase
MQTAKRAIRSIIGRMGYTIGRQRPPVMGESPWLDMQRFVPASGSPVILDVGANVGQSVRRFRAVYPSAVIHSFEPSRGTFDVLRKNIAGMSDVFAWNYALGATPGSARLFENCHSDMSSLLPLDTAGWGTIEAHAPVEMTTVDEFLAGQDIPRVDILKSDTQGYDLEVLKGADSALRQDKIALVYSEFIFSPMYRDLPAFDEMFRYLTDCGFVLVSIYDFHYQHDCASFADVLFANPRMRGR